MTLDFEDAARCAFENTFENVAVKGCFYHLTQNSWRHVQAPGLSPTYKENEEVRIFCSMIDRLALLPVDEVVSGMAHLKDNVPEELRELLNYFDANYVSGKYQVAERNIEEEDGVPIQRIRRQPPLFPPQQWNLHEATINARSRTNNFCEGWNNAFTSLLGVHHPNIWLAVDCLRKDQGKVEIALFNDARGQPPKKKVKRATKDMQDRFSNLCQQYREGTKNLPEFLRGVGHMIRI